MFKSCLLGMLLIVGCTSEPLTQDERALKEERIQDRIERREEHERFTRACVKSGGFVFIESRTGATMHRGVPSKHAVVECVSRASWR